MQGAAGGSKHKTQASLRLPRIGFEQRHEGINIFLSFFPNTSPWKSKDHQKFQVQNGGTKTYVSCMDTAYLREPPPPKQAYFRYRKPSILGTWNFWWKDHSNKKNTGNFTKSVIFFRFGNLNPPKIWGTVLFIVGLTSEGFHFQGAFSESTRQKRMAQVILGNWHLGVCFFFASWVYVCVSSRWFQPTHMKNKRGKIGSFPQVRDEHKKYLKPSPPRYHMILLFIEPWLLNGDPLLLVYNYLVYNPLLLTLTNFIGRCVFFFFLIYQVDSI